MSGGSGINYSTWDHIYVSDDEDFISPYVDTQSLFRMRHRARLEKMAEFQQRGEDLETNFAHCKRLLEEVQGCLKRLQEGREEAAVDEEQEAELRKCQAEVKTLKKDEKSFEKLIEEYRREERKVPWNVDTISKEGFSKSLLNIKPVSKEETEVVKVEKHKTFVDKYEKDIKHFGILQRWHDSQKYLSDNPHLVCEETANSLIAICINFEIDEKHALMEQVAHQAIVMQFILDLAKNLKVDPRGCFRQFFTRIKTAEKPYQDAFDRELELLKERVCSCARMRMESAMKEIEEEEKQKRLGPGGLDPVEVYASLPKEIQRSFDEKNIDMLQEAMNKLEPEEGKYLLKQCIDSGLWVPETGDDDEEKEEEEDKED
ncbi:LOW QUALITY PROTEIN: hsp90 co-chaperone Cdc37-like [Gouania willdenowi]|uniref:LOW QUALITY PROTEIN: hsp90 co-chaperone Cdc37-like n=1 Tax=Gouania willdenowi TaxID=441366 RepID=UPI001056560D|nr:LOW QUALITY PROTEIN: hsp90 co-chaperone Cdc37-like [Gouania willdenowi]